MPRRSSFLASCPPGLRRVLREQLGQIPGVELTFTGTGRQADYVLFDAGRDGRVAALRSPLAQDVVVVATSVRRAGRGDPGELALRCWQSPETQHALSVWSEQLRPLSSAMTFRVTVSLQTGPRQLRDGMRAALTEVILRGRPRWRPAPDGELEILLAEWRAGELITGLRLGGNRAAAGPGAELTPAAAAALVHLALGPRGLLVDPCCGRGGILGAAVAAGWTAQGYDVDEQLLEAAARAAPAAAVSLGDVREILEPDASVSACVTRLPVRAGDSGRRTWLKDVLAEISRVTRRKGLVVLLADDIPHEVIPPSLRLRREIPVRLEGGPERVFVLQRA